MRRSRHGKTKQKKRATSGSLRNVKMGKGFVNSLQGYVEDNEREWSISWNKGTPTKKYVIHGNLTGVEFHPSRNVTIHTHHDRVISQPSAVDLANIIDAREMISIIATPNGLHMFRKGTEDRRTNYEDALDITNEWIEQDFTIDDLNGKIGEFGIEYVYLRWKEVKENGIDVDKIFKQDNKEEKNNY